MPVSKYKLVSCVVLLATSFLIYEFIHIGYYYPRTLIKSQMKLVRSSQLTHRVIGYRHGNKEVTTNNTGVYLSANNTSVNDSNVTMETIIEEDAATEEDFICVNESELFQRYERTHDEEDKRQIERRLSFKQHHAVPATDESDEVWKTPVIHRGVPVEYMQMYDLDLPPKSNPSPQSLSEGQPKIPGFQKRNGDTHVIQGQQMHSGNKPHSDPKVKLSSAQLKLAVYPIQSNSDLLKERKFPPWQPSDNLNNYTHYLKEAQNGSNPFITGHSLNPDVIARGMFQQAQMNLFCRKHRMKSNLPRAPTDLDALFQHLLYDDSERIVYCYVPKNSCSNMKRLLLILNGILPPESVHKRPPEDVLKKVHSFRTLSPDGALHRLNTYMKVVIVRNPMERLLSSYRNKIEPPLDWDNRHYFPDKVKVYILQHYRNDPFRQWVHGNQSQPIYPTFGEFSHYMTLFKLSDYNEHFKAVLDLCYPCAVHYDFYANFKSLDYDIYALMDYLNIPMEYYPQLISHRKTPTFTYMDKYFSSLSHVEKEKIFNVFSNELDFYYTLYPEERGMHMSL